MGWKVPHKSPAWAPPTPSGVSKPAEREQQQQEWLGRVFGDTVRDVQTSAGQPAALTLGPEVAGNSICSIKERHRHCCRRKQPDGAFFFPFFFLFFLLKGQRLMKTHITLRCLLSWKYSHCSPLGLPQPPYPHPAPEPPTLRASKLHWKLLCCCWKKSLHNWKGCVSLINTKYLRSIWLSFSW